MNKKRLREIAVHVVNSKHGDFLRVFADAYQRADRENEAILRDAWIRLVLKYGLDAEYPEEKGES